MEPLITNDAIVLGLLMLVLGLVFYTSTSINGYIKRFYDFIPPLLLCYFLPALLHWPLGLISGEVSKLGSVAQNYLLPASLLFFCLSIDFKTILNLGPKAITMFFAGSLGVAIGGPLALMFCKWALPAGLLPDLDNLWKGLATIAGSWIGGAANQAAIKEVFQVDDNLFASMLVVDVMMANLWFGVLIYGASKADQIDTFFKADKSSLQRVFEKIEHYKTAQKIPNTNQLIMLLAIGFVGVGISHLCSEYLVAVLKPHESWLNAHKLSALLSGFFWVVVIATTLGIGCSYTRLSKFEQYGASKFALVFIYILVATIGMKMKINQVFEHPGLFVIGFVWILIHVLTLVIVGKLLKAPYFFLAVASQANIGGPASAPIVASAFHPSLAPVGVLLAVMGYAVGTYGALFTAYLMAMV